MNILIPLLKYWVPQFPNFLPISLFILFSFYFFFLIFLTSQVKMAKSSDHGPIFSLKFSCLTLTGFKCIVLYHTGFFFNLCACMSNRIFNKSTWIISKPNFFQFLLSQLRCEPLWPKTLEPSLFPIFLSKFTLNLLINHVDICFYICPEHDFSQLVLLLLMSKPSSCLFPLFSYWSEIG